MAMKAEMGLLGRALASMRSPAAASELRKLDESVAATAGSVKPCAALIAIVQRAWEVGQTLDLSGVGYGPPHWNTLESFIESPFPYYRFLAGLVRSQHCKRIIEIGTHFGGSTQSMLRGAIDQSETEIITIDITDLNVSLHGISEITKITGDANRKNVIQEVALNIRNRPADLLYVDADHRFIPTMTNLGIYVLLSRPKLVAIDDIVLNPEMRALWNVLRITFDQNAINCAEIIPEIRSAKVGFGLLQIG